jgi:adenosylmethionine-8-amino-7-oxononanoate aminotransferase
MWLYGFDGNRDLYAISSRWVNLFGHANSRIHATWKMLVVATCETLEP